ncbi:MAG TPA: hypothetical protein DEP51_04405 [Clostridiales bacterium]|nr:hypothetical protein [Clostridiales bacterium]
MENFFKRLGEKNPKSNNKRKIENLCFFIGILIITLILMKSIWKGNTEKSKLDEKENYTDEVLAIENNNQKNNEIENKLEDILSSIKNVGKVNVFINYSESTSVIPLYDESTTTSTTTEGDSSGGTRNTVETENQKEVVFTEKSGLKDPVIQKTLMPIIEGAIITAEGASNASVKTDIISAVQAVTGLSIDRIQVFEMQ